MSVIFSSFKIVVKSSRLISSSISSALDIMFSMLFSLLLVNEIILLCFFIFFLIVLKSFFVIPLLIEKNKLRLALVFSTSATTIVANKAMETLPFAADKTKKELSK